MKKFFVNPSWILKALALVFLGVGLYLFLAAYSFLPGGQVDYVSLALTAISILCLLSLVIVEMFEARPFNLIYIFEIVSLVLALYAFASLLSPFIDGIATFFTVTMGDMAAKAQYVPRSIAAAVLYVVASLLIVVSSFFANKEKGVEDVR